MNNINKCKSDIILDLNIDDDRFGFATSIDEALTQAETELVVLNETIESIKELKPQCDKLDYILAASSGALCGVIDIFLVGKPGESPLGDITDKWFANRTIDFAKLCGYKGNKNSLSSAINFLEEKFKIPYDQSVGGGIFRELINLTPSNHHFKSLGHNPTLLGLFFSILNQFTNTSDFVSNEELISLNNSDGKFELQGKNIPSKLFCGIANWIGHLISDVSGSSGSKGRGMGIPSPIWAWSNDVIAIKAKLNIPVIEFDKSVNELALKLFKPKYFMPVHGEYRFLRRHGHIAELLGMSDKNIFIMANGKTLEVDANSARIGQQVQSGIVLVDGLGVGDVGNIVIRDRQMLSENGMILVVFSLDSKTGKLVGGPDIITRGFVYVRESEDLMEEIRAFSKEQILKLEKEGVKEWSTIKGKVRDSLCDFVYKRTRRNPMILPIITEVNLKDIQQ